MQLILLVGLQGAGKSTFYKQHFCDTHLRLNFDMLKTKHREKLLFEACLASKTPTVIDKTNPTPDDRRYFIEPALAHHFEVIAYYFDIPFETAWLQNNQRVGKAKIPEVGLKSTAKKLQPPQFNEGFDRIFYVTLENNAFKLNELSKESMDAI